MTTNMNSTRTNTFRKNITTASRQYNGRVNSPIMTHQKNRNKKHYRRCHSRNSNITDAFAGEIDFGILASQNIVPSQAGKVLGDYAVDLSIFDIIDHPLEGGAVIVRSGPSVIHVFAYYVQAMGFGIVLKHNALGLDAAALAL